MGHFRGEEECESRDMEAFFAYVGNELKEKLLMLVISHDLGLFKPICPFQVRSNCSQAASGSAFVFKLIHAPKVWVGFH